MHILICKRNLLILHMGEKHVHNFFYQKNPLCFQIDFSTKMVFNIEKGSIRKQFPFSQVKSCAYSEGRRFRISFYGRPDYELEAASVEDKNKVSESMGALLYSRMKQE